MATMTDADRLSRLEGAYEHLATKADLAEVKGEMKADLANLKFTLAAWMLLLTSAATGIIIAVDRLAT